MKRKFGKWTLKRSNYTLEHTNSYYIDLERCRTCAEMLDWIMQVATKSWCTSEDLGCLVQALNDIFKPQGSLCSGGVDRGPINPRAILNERPKAMKRIEGIHDALLYVTSGD